MWPSRLLAVLGIALWGCALYIPWAFIPNDSSPELAGLNMDQAATACLNWAWLENHTREVAGGIEVVNGKLICTQLTLGTRNSVVYDIGPFWLVHFHTHTDRGRMSAIDQEVVRDLDPMGRPSYVRESGGVIWVYECFAEKHGYECAERVIPR